MPVDRVLTIAPSRCHGVSQQPVSQDVKRSDAAQRSANARGASLIMATIACAVCLSRWGLPYQRFLCRTVLILVEVAGTKCACGVDRPT
jgi:hypothetical protein